MSLSAHAQYYLRGELKSEQNRPLANARILLHSTGYVYYSGHAGSFGIPLTDKTDSITITLAGYQPLNLRVDPSQYLSLQMRLLHPSVHVPKNRLLSITKDLRLDRERFWSPGGESYSALVENEFIPAREYPESGFALRMDKASYSNVRRFLRMDAPVPPDAVRIEELLNYFDFGYREPPAGEVFSLSSELAVCPWNPSNRLLFLQIGARKVEAEAIPPSNLVFLIDVSGSMDMPNRLPLLKSAFRLLVNNLREQDTVSIVVYGGAAGVYLKPTSGKEHQKIRHAIDGLWPGGATPGASGILTAYELAKRQFIEGGNNRVILATDGDFNVGQQSEEELEQLIAAHRQSGIYLSCLGVGMGNYKDSKLEVLAKKGNGNFAYLDHEQEAEKVLIQEFTRTLYAVADDASLHLRFHPDMAKKYRLIGFDNKQKALADTLLDLEGGELGSGFSAMALLEIEPEGAAGEALPLNGDSLSTRIPRLADLELRYRLPGDSARQVISFSVPARTRRFEDLSPQHRFAAAVALFGSMLRQSPHVGKASWKEVTDIATAALNPEDPAKVEFLELLGLARKVYSKKKRRKLIR